MNTYRAFGGLLSCEFPLVELPPAEGRGGADWRISVSSGEPSALGACIGEERVNATAVVRCHELPDGLALAFDDTGVFAVRCDGREITWHRPAGDANEHAVREDLLGRVMAIALHESGLFCLHASAVSIAGAGIAFMAPKYHGKSSFALELVRQGAAFVTDDMLPVRLGGRTELLPGVPRVRLWNDTAKHFDAVDAAHAADAKHVLSCPEVGDGIGEGVPFSVGYVLTPVTELPDGAVVRRERLHPSEAAMMFLSMGKVTGLLGKRHAIDALQRASAIAETVPLYQLFVRRDLAVLAEAAATVAAWPAQG